MLSTFIHKWMVEDYLYWNNKLFDCHYPHLCLLRHSFELFKVMLMLILSFQSRLSNILSEEEGTERHGWSQVAIRTVELLRFFRGQYIASLPSFPLSNLTPIHGFGRQMHKPLAPQESRVVRFELLCFHI